MQIIKHAAIISIAAILTACGDGSEKNISFKNTSTLMESYSKITENMTKSDLTDFNRNFMLVLDAADTPPEDLSLRDWKIATNKSNSLKYLGEDNARSRALTREFLREDAQNLNGKSASYINKRGDKIKSHITKAATKDTREEIDKFKAILKKIKKDKIDHTTAYKAAKKKKKKLIASTSIYKASGEMKSLKDWIGNGLTSSGSFTFTNPHSGSITSGQFKTTIEYKGYKLSTFHSLSSRLRNIKPGTTGTQSFTTTLRPSKFYNEDGNSLDRDHEFSKKPKDYKITAHPLTLNVNETGKDRVTLNYSLPSEEATALRLYGFRHKKCDDLTDHIKQAIQIKTENIDIIKNGNLDDLPRRQLVASKYSKGCAA